jgi:hypothetical protein
MSRSPIADKRWSPYRSVTDLSAQAASSKQQASNAAATECSRGNSKEETSGSFQHKNDRNGCNHGKRKTGDLLVTGHASADAAHPSVLHVLSAGIEKMSPATEAANQHEREARNARRKIANRP